MAIKRTTIILPLLICTTSCIGMDRGKVDEGDAPDTPDAGKSDSSNPDAQRPPYKGSIDEIPIEASTQEIKAFCGNGIVDLNEQCDGTLSVQGMSCESLGYFVGGNVTCDPITCTYDTSQCSLGPVCGNGVVEMNEQCEVGLFSEMKCSDFDDDYDDGYVTCDFRTCRYNLSGCNAKSVCGNSILEGSEQCDGDELNDMTCTALNYGFSGGTLRCDPDTCSFDISDCEYSRTCGNGVIEPGEQCDGYNLASMSCSFLGYYSGTLTCSSDCRFDTSGCVSTTTSSGCFRGADPRSCVITPPSDN